MSGAAGIVSFNGREQAKEVLPRLIQALRWNENEEPSSQADEACGVAVVDREGRVKQFLVEKEGVALAFFGRIARSTECRAEPALPLQPAGGNRPSSVVACTLAEELVDLYLENGVKALQGLNGQYVVMVWDRRLQKLVVVNDRYGLQPVYYWHAGEQLAVATSLKALAGLPRFPKQVNPVALFDLLATGQMLGERTLLAAAEALPPATALTFAGGKVHLTRYWQPPLYQSGERTIPTDMYADQLGDLIQAAVRRHAGPGSCLLLTGGLDSRWLAGSLASLYGASSLTANTIGHSRARDTLLARKVAGTVGLAHQVIPVNERYLADYSRDCVVRSEGNMNCSAGWILGEVSYLRRAGVRAVVTGVGAEMISGRHWLAEQNETDPARALQLLCSQHWHFQPAAALFHPSYRQMVSCESMALLEECLREAPSDDPAGRYDYLHLVQHRRHPTGNILAADAEVSEPFFDNELVDYALGTPPQLRSLLYKKALQNCFPQLAGIQTTERGLSVRDDLSNKQNHALKIEHFLFRLSRKLACTFDREARWADPPWQTLYTNHWIRTSSRDFVTSVFRRAGRLEPWISVPAVTRLVNDHLAGKKFEAGLISALMTAILTLEYLME